MDISKIMKATSKKYSDIINLEHHTSKTRPKMSIENRSAQFAPFAALTGYEDMIEEDARYVDEKRYASIEKKEDFTFETVLSSRYKLNILKKAKQEGYFIKCVFVLTVDPHINISRVETRVALGGHDVDKKKIVERYHKSLANIKELMRLCDILHVYDNTIQPIRIIRKHKEELSIFPNENWTEEMIIELI